MLFFTAFFRKIKKQTLANYFGGEGMLKPGSDVPAKLCTCTRSLSIFVNVNVNVKLMFVHCNRDHMPLKTILKSP